MFSLRKYILKFFQIAIHCPLIENFKLRELIYLLPISGAALSVPSLIST